MNSLAKYLVLGIFIIFQTACSGIENSQYYEYLSSTEEAALCLTNYPQSTSVKVAGTATFFKRGINLVIQVNTSTQLPELKNLTLGDPLQTALPIRFAEVVIYNSKNKIVQCGRTNNTGALKATDGASDLLLPATPDTYSIRVLSRTNIQLNFPGKPSFELNASVKKDKYSQQLYTLEKSVFSNGVDDVSISLIAYARQTESTEIVGGGFNILNDIYSTYSYLNTKTGTVDTRCLNQKINLYWKAGFNAFQYYYPNADPSTLSSNSFYDQDGDKTLNITGGRLGNTSLENTDHFDDYVIIHELGHFVEDNCGQLITPGGSHVMVSRIDPQLAWSEGWANYLAAQVMYEKISEINPEFEAKMASSGFTTNPTDRKWSFLSTTFGFSDSQLNVGNGTGVMFDIKKSGLNPDTWQAGSYEGFSIDKVDPSRYIGEGHFREGAITRGLFKLSNSCGSTCASAPISFENIWKSVDAITGASANGKKFKSSHSVIESIKSNIGAAAWTGDLQTKAQGEALHLASDGSYTVSGFNKWVSYAASMNLQGAACATGTQIEPRFDDPILSGSNSDQRFSNHFYALDFSITPNLNTISAKFTKVAGTDTEFDLILFQENYVFNSDYTCSSTNFDGSCLTSFVPGRTNSADIVRSNRTAGLVAFKKITDLQSLDKTKKYLLNVRAYTPGKSISASTVYNYELRDGLTDGTGNYLGY